MLVMIVDSWKAVENWFSEMWKAPDFSRFYTRKGVKNVCANLRMFVVEATKLQGYISVPILLPHYCCYAQ